MTVKAQWRCDGCDDTAVVPCDGKPDSWNSLTVSITGSGYPIAHLERGYSFDLCSQCSRQFAREIDPRKWPRASAAAPDQPTSKS